MENLVDNKDASLLSELALGHANGSTADDFDMQALALPQNFQDMLDVQTVLTTVPIRKPNKHEWFRVHPAPNWQFSTMMLKFDGEYYFVGPAMHKTLAQEIEPVTLFTVVTSRDMTLLWPVKLPGAGGELDSFSKAYLNILATAKDQWTRMTWSPSLHQHAVHTTEGLQREPTFPEVGFEDVLRIAYAAKSITVEDHPIVKELQGRS